MSRWYVPKKVFKRLKRVGDVTSKVEVMYFDGRPVVKHLQPARRLHERAVNIIAELREGTVDEKNVLDRLNGVVAEANKLVRRADHDACTPVVPRPRPSKGRTYVEH